MSSPISIFFDNDDVLSVAMVNSENSGTAKELLTIRAIVKNDDWQGLDIYRYYCNGEISFCLYKVY